MASGTSKDRVPITTSIDLNLAAALASAVAALLGLVLLVQNTRTTRQQAKRDEMRMVALLSGRWEGLREQWGIALMTARGADAYYLEVDASERHQYGWRLRRLEEADRKSAEALTALHRGSPMLEVHQWLSQELGKDLASADLIQLYQDESSRELAKEYTRRLEEAFEQILKRWKPFLDQTTEARADMAPYQLATRQVLRFLAEVSGQVLRGLIGPQSVYEAFGAELARNGGAIRALMTDHEHGWISIQPGLFLRVLVLIDLMWAEGARLGELETQPSAAQAAITKRTHGTGRRNRSRVFQLAEKLGPGPNARKLRRLLRHAEHPPEPRDWNKIFGLRSSDESNRLESTTG
jgi:hypothetical protein